LEKGFIFREIRVLKGVDDDDIIVFLVLVTFVQRMHEFLDPRMTGKVGPTRIRVW
jgi:hypothetical protein